MTAFYVTCALLILAGFAGIVFAVRIIERVWREGNPDE